VSLLPQETAPNVPAAVVETHISVLVFLGKRVYKLKKPVRFDFLDFSTVDRRREACHREVDLNRRLSPDVYLGVLDVVDAEGVVRDHMVEMVRLPDDRRLSSLVRDPALDVEPAVRTLARCVAAFHEAAVRGPVIDEHAGHASVVARWEQDLAELGRIAAEHPGLLDGRTLADVAVRARRWLAGREPLFADRQQGGHAVDGHGDLRADDVFCLDDGPRVLDCIEFSDRLRHGDVWDDVAFLLMDLERLGRGDLGDRFADAYREFTGDTAPAALVHVFVARRALVRVKVGALRVTQLVPGPDRRAASAEVESLLALAHTHLTAAEVRLVLLGGLPGTGKSTVAEALGTESGAVVMGSDATRKEQAGLPTTVAAPEGFREGLYDLATTDATYALLLDRARVALTHGESVVLDATWADARRREEAREIGRRGGARVVELRCVCPSGLAAERLRARAASGPTESDADEEIAARVAATADDWPEASVLDTSASVAACVLQARPHLGASFGADR